MARKRSDDLKQLAAGWLDAGDAGADEPAPADKAPRPMQGVFDDREPMIIATAKSRTSSGRLLRRTLYFSDDEWRAVLAAADSDTRATGERVTAAEIVRRAVRGWLDIGGDG